MVVSKRPVWWFALSVFIAAASVRCGAAASGPPDDAGAIARDGGGTDAGADATDGGAPLEDGGAADDAGAPQDGGSEARDGGPARDGGANDAGVRDAGVPRDGGPGCPLPTRDGGALNAQWIGGPCTQDSDCNYAGGVCLTASDGFPAGTCSQRCTTTCPDRAGADNTGTFCVAGRGRLAGGGMCVSRCDFDKAPLGCRDGYHCVTGTRPTEPNTYANACLPGANSCYQQASDACVSYRARANPLDRPDGCPNELCDVKDAMLVSSTINGVRYRNSAGNLTDMFVSCPMALALHRLGDILKDLDVVEVRHIGTYNCRQIAGTNCSLSMHGLAMAIDIGGLVTRDGTVVSVLNDWQPTNSIPIEPSASNRCRFDYTPTTPKAQLLYELSYRMCDDRIWSIILTPNYNAAHDNHYHVDLTPGYARPFLGHDGPTLMRPNESRE